MAKFKGFTGIKSCQCGEVYRFKNGVATVPGMRIYRRGVTITLKEFNSMTQGDCDVRA